MPSDTPSGGNLRDFLSEIAASTAQAIGNEFLASLVHSMREAMDVSMVFITTGIGDPPTRVRTMASWRADGPGEAMEYDLEGTPCRLVYEGETLVVSEGLYHRFEKENGYEGYIGVPLLGGSGKVRGHLAILSRRPFEDTSTATAIAVIFGQRVAAEIQRLEHEREREALLASLTRANRRLSNRHAALRQSNETKALLIGMMAHDLRNPLSVILNRGELIAALIEGARETDPRANESCKVIIDTAERMDRLIASALVQAKSEAESISLDVQSFPASRAVQVAVSLNSMSAEKKGMTITVDAPDDVIVRGDEDRIVEALDNLIRNAVKYSHPGQEVRVETALLPDVVEFRVSDQGQGLTPEDSARAFRQFQRLSAKPTGGESSTGLGLSIVKTIAEAHGGTARAESQGRGQGSCFSFSIPRTLV